MRPDPKLPPPNLRSGLSGIMQRQDRELPRSGNPALARLEDRLSSQLSEARSRVFTDKVLEPQEVDQHRKDFNSAFGKDVTTKVFAAVDARIEQGRGIRPKDIKHAYSIAHDEGRSEKALTGNIKLIANNIVGLKKEHEDAQFMLSEAKSDLESEEREADADLRPRNVAVVAKLDAAKTKAARAEGRLREAETTLKKHETMLHSLANRPDEGEDEPELRNRAHLLMTKLNSAVRERDAAQNFLSQEERKLPSHDEYVQGQIIENENWPRFEIIEDYRGPQAFAEHLERATQRVEDSTRKIEDLKAELMVAQRKLTTYQDLPKDVVNRSKLEALGKDPRLANILHHRAGKEMATSRNESLKAQWINKEIAKTAGLKGVGAVAAPVTVPISFWIAISAENVQRRMHGAQTLLGGFPFARQIAGSIADAHEQKAASAALDGTLTYGTMMLSMPGMPGFSAGSIVGSATSGAIRHVGTAGHHAVSMAVGDTLDAAVSDITGRLVGKGVEGGVEEGGGQVMPKLPVPTTSGKAYVDLSDTEAVKGLLEYLGPGEDLAALSSTDNVVREAEVRRLDYRETHFGMKSNQHLERHGKASNTVLAKQLSEVVSELDQTQPSGEATRVPPLYLLYAALGWLN